MTTDCVDVCATVIDRLLEAGFSEEELELDAEECGENHDAILKALSESRIERRKEHSLVVLGEFVLQAINKGYARAILREMDLSDKAFYGALRETGLTQVHQTLGREIKSK